MAQVMEPTEIKQQIATTEIPDTATQILNDQPPSAAAVDKKKRTIPRWALPVGAIVVIVVLLGWWLYARQFESTDDAQIEGHIHAISPRISGTVVYINPKVENNQYVEAGTLLLELDPNDYQAALEHARADLITREASARSAGVNVPITNVSAFSQFVWRKLRARKHWRR